MTRITPRLACNLVYAHLLSRTEHSTCTEHGCAADCGVTKFLAWLDAPLFPWEVREAERRRERARALMRGELPA